MTEAKMPLMLENGMNGAMQVDQLDVDDLFGDGVGLSLQAARPPTKQLRQRIDELRTRGCCQGVAWSRSGAIASVSPDGRHLETRFLRSHPDDGDWGLSEPTKIELISTNPSSPIVHLAWASTASPELAVIDAAGRVSILTYSINLNRPFATRKWDHEPGDDLQAVVGCYWLSLAPQSKQYYVCHGPAVKDGNSYRYESSFVHAYGPWHPNPSKSALLCVTASGNLKMFWAQNNNKIEETSLELESINSSDDLITHAALHSDKSSLWVVLATASKQLKVVRVGIHWGLPQSQSDNKPPPGSQSLNPTMQEKHVAISSWLPNGPTVSPTDSAMTQISHLEILPSTMDLTGQGWAPLVILAVRTYLPTPNTPYQETQSIIDKWEVINDQPQSLHPAFEQLGSRRNSTGSAPTPTSRLKKYDPVVINKIIIGVQTLQYGRVICLAFSDGSVEYRDRFTMQEIYNDINLDRVMTLNQVGFTFQDDSPCLQMAFSPTNCSLVKILDSGKVKWSKLHYPLGDIGNSNQDAQYSAVLAGLTVAASTAAFNNINHDDILAVARPYADKKRFTFDWINEIVRMLKIPVDYSEDTHHDSLVRNSSLQMCLSILNHLGYKGMFQPRSFGGKFAMLALNARNVVILITIASNTPVNIREKLSPLDEHEVVDALSGCAKWSLDLLSWLTDSLFALLDDEQFLAHLTPQRFSEMSAYLQSRSDVSLHLLLCSSTRGFLSAVCRRILHLEILSNRAIEFYERRAAIANANDPSAPTPKGLHTVLYKAYQKMQRVTSSSLVKVQEFDRLLTVLNNDIRSAYQTSLASLANKNPTGAQMTGKAVDAQIKNAQIHCELNMLLASSPPAAFFNVLSKFFNADLKSYRAQADPSKLFFADFDLLEIDDDRRSLAARKARGKYVDVFKRVELVGPPVKSAKEAEEAKAPQWRRCVRCSAVMEDVSGSRPGFTFVLAQQRKCSCGGHWALLPRGALVS
ncbi:mediator of rna polymerase ii transcription subunit 16 [Colletotrichum truncatum]|uniref:Mediator of rna polymerase ii transcription subunit 16 n=1 Tax=Colletotrichum truncatum TaxID=5467 RepID=A0ACC3YXD4_COLTU|nr:mediator of rna polymerase ii transcription subunit 16 [Colletotrichum truncatum]KAF6792478.1 mediator of rna polymerase ii transcription subunit 16 [Colletotrichum truncatum]